MLSVKLSINRLCGHRAASEMRGHRNPKVVHLRAALASQLLNTSAGTARGALPVLRQRVISRRRRALGGTDHVLEKP